MKIQILMSTYNGEAYLRTQLDSIVDQTIKNKYLLIRDDGSTDETLDIIKEYANKFEWISYYQGHNIGVRKSFMELVANADPQMDYIAFADQDDYWLPEKLDKAVEKMENMREDIPQLYCSDKTIVGKNLEDLDVTVSRFVKKSSFGNALVQNICTGCTAVINNNLLVLLQHYMPIDPDELIMHDWWLYLAASCFGDVCYDENAYIRYRQHGNNAAGAMINKTSLLKYRIGQLFKPRGEIYRQIKVFDNVFGGILDSKQKSMIYKVLSSKQGLVNRILLITDKKVFRQKLVDDLVFRGSVLIGKL